MTMTKNNEAPSDRGIPNTSQFWDALARHVEASKPDPLLRGQIENLHLAWERRDGDGGESALSQYHVGGERKHSLCGTLTFSSELVSVAIHVRCECKMNCNDYDQITDFPHPSEEVNNIITGAGAGDDIPSKVFDNEFYIRLTVTANFVSASDENSSTKDKDRKERAMKRKLRAGTIERLRADPLVRRLLVSEWADGCMKAERPQATKDDPNKGDFGVVLCEAIIQQSLSRNAIKKCDSAAKSIGIVPGELEERVNVHEDSLEGIRNAIFSHAEDNLDVLELLLSMPYLPRLASGFDIESDQEVLFSSLAAKAHLRLLEDAMFDACEREGEDEMLLDLNISDVNDNGNESATIEEGPGRKSRRKNAQWSKRVKQSQS